jgi:cell division protein FtsB
VTPTAGRPEANRYQRAFQGSYEGALQYWPVLAVMLMIGITLLSGYELFYGENGWLRMKRIETDTTRLLAENQDLTVQIESLKEQERLLARDSFVLEKIVREQLRLSKPGEILYLFDETVNAGSTDRVTVAKQLPEKVEEEAAP